MARLRLVLVGVLGVLLLGGPPARGADRYSPWQPPAQAGGMPDQPTPKDGEPPSDDDGSQPTKALRAVEPDSRS